MLDSLQKNINNDRTNAFAPNQGYRIGIPISSQAKSKAYEQKKVFNKPYNSKSANQGTNKNPLLVEEDEQVNQQHYPQKSLLDDEETKDTLSRNEDSKVQFVKVEETKQPEYDETNDDIKEDFIPEVTKQEASEQIHDVKPSQEQSEDQFISSSNRQEDAQVSCQQNSKSSPNNSSFSNSDKEIQEVEQESDSESDIEVSDELRGSIEEFLCNMQSEKLTDHHVSEHAQDFIQNFTKQAAEIESNLEWENFEEALEHILDSEGLHQYFTAVNVPEDDIEVTVLTKLIKKTKGFALLLVDQEATVKTLLCSLPFDIFST